MPRTSLSLADLVIGTECGGSDACSGITANPAIGAACDRLVEAGGSAIFEELGELFGCEEHMAARAVTPELGLAIKTAMKKAWRHYALLDQSSFGGGNITGGLSTIEEKSIGAYAKSGSKPIMGMLRPGIHPPRPGLYLMDMIPDNEGQWGFANINDNATITEQIACGAHIILFSTGRGSVVGSAIAPVIKICSNTETYRRLEEDMDVNAGSIIEQGTSITEVGEELVVLIRRTASGEATKSEALGHQEFILGYKSFEPLGPSCLPV